MSTNKILKLGNPKLYKVSTTIEPGELPEAGEKFTELKKIILEYRSIHNAGRAIAAPQIGFMKRMICIYVNDVAHVMINPVFIEKSIDTFVLWDDCMSFPELLVKVRRHKKCKVRFKDFEWKDHEWELENDLSELVQHEYDHLDGILAVQRAIDDKSFALQSERDKLKDL
ncbi:MAG: peptide deformylase [Bacteroidales bacterium]